MHCACDCLAGKNKTRPNGLWISIDKPIKNNRLSILVDRFTYVVNDFVNQTDRERGMAIFKGIVYFLSGLLLIGAIVCAVIFSLNASVAAIGGALMFLCFGVAGFVLGINAGQIVALFKPQSSAGRGRTT